MIGRRILPCGHHRVRIEPAAGTYERWCDICKRWYTAEVSESLYWTQKLGVEGLVLHWVEDDEEEVDPIAATSQGLDGQPARAQAEPSTVQSFAGQFGLSDAARMLTSELQAQEEQAREWVATTTKPLLGLLPDAPPSTPSP